MISAPVTNHIGSLDPFVGRDRELADLQRELDSGQRLVTLAGLPGAGKTRLARRLIETALEHAADGRWAELWFVDLTAAREPKDALGALARVLGVQLPVDASLEAGGQSLAKALDGRGRCLVVLDNFEQLVEGLAPSLSAWLPLCPEAQWLITSRHRLGLAGEHLFEVRPLALPNVSTPLAELDGFESVRLLRERARALGVELSLTEDTRPEIVAVLELLDGLPLAIEMAAARLNLLSLGELRERLSERLDLLRRRRDGDARRHSLRAAIEWSWQLLDGPERLALMSCSVFRGGFDLRAAESVVPCLPDDAPVLERIQSLRDKSLIQMAPMGEARLSLCLSVADFAAEALAEAGERYAAWERHGRYFAEHGELARDRLKGSGAGEALRQLSRERDNFLAVIERAQRVPDEHASASPLAEAALEVGLALEASWAVHGQTDRLPELLASATAIAQRRAVSSSLLVQTVMARSRILRRLGQVQGSRDVLESVSALLDGSASTALVAELESSRAAVAVSLGELEAGREHALRALELYRERHDPHAEAMARCTLAVLLGMSARIDEATAEFEHALTMLQRVGAPLDEIAVEINLALFGIHHGLTEGCRVHAERALTLARELPFRRAEGFAMAVLAVGAIEARDPESGREWAGRSADCLLRLGDQHMAATSLLHRSEAGWHLGDYRGAQADLERAQALGRFEDPRFREHWHILAAERAWAEQRLDQAHDDVSKALEACGGSNFGHMYHYMSQLAALEVLLGRPEEARQRLESARALADRVASPLYQATGRVYAGFVELSDVPGALAGETDTVEPPRHPLEAVLTAALALGDDDRAPADRSAVLHVATQRLLATLPDSLRARLEGRARDPGRARLIVEASGHWFRAPGGEPVDLSRRPLLARLLQTLVEARLERDGVAVTTQELIERVWPDEIILPEAAGNRVYFSIKALRKAGLRDLLVRDEGGYRLDPRAAVVRVGGSVRTP